MNRCQFIGNLTKEPQVRTTTNGKRVGTFTVACNRKVGEDWKADYVNIVLWGDFAFDRLHKGTRVYVEGRLGTRTYEQNGEKKYMTEVTAAIVEVIDRPQKPEQNPGAFDKFGDASDPFGAPAYRQNDIPF